MRENSEGYSLTDEFRALLKFILHFNFCFNQNEVGGHTKMVKICSFYSFAEHY
jgi:hypothetical protein